MSTPSEKLAESLAVIAYKQMRSVESEINRRRGEPMRPADIHDESLSSGQGFPVALRRASGCFTERVHHFAVVPLSAVPARNAEPDIHSQYRAVEIVTED